MKCLRIVLLVMLSTTFIMATAQTKKVAKDKKSSLCQLLKGQWQTEDDANVILNFKGKRYIELYGKDTTDNSNYALSYSCELKDSIRKNIYSLDKKVYVLFYKGNKVEQCNELLNLTNSILSWMNNDNGKIFVYKRVKK